MSNDVLGIALCAVLGIAAALVLWRNPGLWRDMRKHYSPPAIATRMQQRAAMHRRPRTEEEALAQIRLHLAALGHPVDSLTDDELRERVATFSRAVAKAGMSTRDASLAARRLAEGLKDERRHG